MDPTRGDSRYNLNYSMSSIGLSLADQADMYGNPAAVAALGGRPPSGGLIQTMGGSGGTGVGLSSRGGGGGGGLMPNAAQCQTLGNTNNATSPQQHQRGIKRTGSDCYEDHHRAGGSNSSLAQSLQVLDSCGTAPGAGGNGQQQQQGGNVPDVVDDSYNSLQNKKSPPANGKKTKGRVKIKMEYIDNKLRRYTTFSKRKTGIMKKAYELSTLTGTQVMLLVASETGHVYTFATRKLQPMITSEAGKQLIQTCLNSPDPPSVGGGDQRMSATGFEETELSYNIADEDSKDDRSPLSSGNESEDSSDVESNGPVAFSGSLLNALEATNTSKKDDRTMQQSAQTKKMASRVVASTAAAPMPSERLPHTTAAATAAAAGSRRNYQNTNGSLMVDSESTIANIPQDMLLKLIQSGHLQLHTEEDGHQYVAIPLTSTAANLIKSGKMTATAAAAGTTASAVQPTILPKSAEATKQLPSPTMAIKQELE